MLMPTKKPKKPKRPRFRSWDLRLIEPLDRKEVEVCEVFYDARKRPHSWSAAIHVVAETVAGIRFTQRQISAALRKPVLVEKKRGPHRVLAAKRS